MKTAIGVWILMLCPLLAFAEDPATVRKWQEHCDRAEALLKHRKAHVSADEILAADAEYARAAEVAIAAGMSARAIRALKGRIDCLEANFEYLGVLKVEYQILHLQEEMGSAAARDLAITKQDVGYLETVFLNPSKAIRYLREAEQWFLAAGDDDELAQTRVRLVSAYTLVNQHGLALAAAESTEEYFRKTKDNLSRAELLMLLGDLHLKLGRNSKALACYQGARKLDPEGGVVPVGEYLAALGSAYRVAGKNAEARKCFEESLRGSRRIENRFSAAYRQLDLIDLAAAEGKHAEVIRTCKQILAAGPGTHRLRAGIYRRAGTAHLALGKHDAALRDFGEALVAAAKSGNGFAIVEAQLGLARVHAAREEWGKALTHLEAGFAHMGQGVHARDPLSGIQQRSVLAETFGLALEAAFRQPDPARTLEILERTRAGAVVEGLGPRQALSRPDPAPEFRDALARARAKLAIAHQGFDAAVATGLKEKVHRAEIEVHKAQNDYYIALEPMQRGTPAAVLSGGTPVPHLADIQSALGADQALVHYAFVGKTLRAMVVTRDTASTRNLGPAAEVRAAAAELGAQIRLGGDATAADRLRKTLIAALGLPAGVRHLLISPDGLLARLPFVLISPDLETAFVPSGTAWAMLAKSRVAPGEGVLAMGDPSYPTPPQGPAADVYRGIVDLVRLPHTRQEALDATGPGDVCLLGRNATENGLRKALPGRKRWRAVHFACHGFFDPRRPSWSALALSPGAVEDGFLTVLEVFGLRVPADLVVLSACETGIGESVPGECMVALPTAFLHAGSSRVVASLWRVDDRATGVFMKEFYRSLKPCEGRKGSTAGEALESARAAVRAAGFTHPRHWAAWVLWGLPD